MNSKQHHLLAAQISKNVKFLHKYEGKELQWSIFRDEKNALLTVCTPKEESLSFIPVTQFYYKLLTENKSDAKAYSRNPRVHDFERAVVITLTLPKSFCGKIKVYAGIDNYSPLQAEVTWDK